MKTPNAALLSTKQIDSKFYKRNFEEGLATLPEGQEMVMPGDTVKLGIELITPVAMEEKGKFAIREGLLEWNQALPVPAQVGRTVGAGVVTKINK